MLILTKNTIKDIAALAKRKGRQEQGAWMAEGDKMVGDLLGLDHQPFHCFKIIATAEWWQKNSRYETFADECYTASHDEIKRISSLNSPQHVIAVFGLPESVSVCPTLPSDRLSILLDQVQDPGNIGTIIRTADWFGVRDIYCAPGTCDCFSPKVVQATMSALAHVKPHYFRTNEEMYHWLSECGSSPIYGTFLEGQNIYQTDVQKTGLLVMGNEGQGISAEVATFVNKKLLIPTFSPNGEHVESLNVSIATAICLSEFCRR